MFGGLLADGQFLGDLISLTVSGFGLFIMIFMRCDGSPESFFQRCRASPLRKGDYLLYTLISCLRLVHRWKGSCQSLRGVFSVWSDNLHVHNNSSTLW